MGGSWLKDAPSIDDWPRELPPTLSVEQAGWLMGLSRSAAYRAARRGDLPTLRIVHRVLIPTQAFLQLLGMTSRVTISNDATLPLPQRTTSPA